MYQRVAVFGGIYSNHLALRVAAEDARRRGVDAIFCLGDLGAFGPHPDRTIELLREHGVQCMQGNYDNSIGNGLPDCQCGYVDPRDNHFARLSYRYTYQNTSPENRRWLAGLPQELRLELGKYQVLGSHGSPRRVNEFLWESTTSTQFLDWLLDEYETDVLIATHTGIKWQRRLREDRCFVNVGVLGRPENDGQTCVWYALLEAKPQLEITYVPITYDHEGLAREMRVERLPEEFIETILTGWWATCLEILPAKERKRGKY